MVMKVLSNGWGMDNSMDLRAWGNPHWLESSLDVYKVGADSFSEKRYVIVIATHPIGEVFRNNKNSLYGFRHILIVHSFLHHQIDFHSFGIVKALSYLLAMT